MSDAFQSRGVKVVFLDANKVPYTSLQVYSHNGPSLWGFALFGHGKDEEYMRGSFVLQSNWYGSATDTLQSTGFEPHFGYGGVIVFTCHAELGEWADVVSPNGIYHGTSGWTWAAAGPRALSPAWWSSWDALVDEMVWDDDE